MCSIHRYEDRDIGLILMGTFDDISRPGGVMLAFTAARTLHTTIACIKVAASAQIKTMRCIRAKKSSLWDLSKRERKYSIIINNKIGGYKA